MKRKTITLGGSGINWSWYLEIERVGKSQCRIIRHWRLHKCRDQGHPDTDGTYNLVEDEKPLKDGWHSRNVIAVQMWLGSYFGAKRQRLKVLNPGYVFGYDGKTAQPAMHGG